MTYSAFCSLVLSYEALPAQQSVAEGWSSSANAASRPYGSGGRAPPAPPQGIFSGGGRPAAGNGQPTSNRQGGNGANQGRGGYDGRNGGNGRQGGNGGGNTGGNGGGRTGRPRPKCQICKAWGHEAYACLRRFDHDFNNRAGNAASTGSSDNQPWVMDSGATDHFTSELERLQVHERYGGNDQVQVANGQGNPAHTPSW